jgi:hypothetical protein
MFIERVVYTMNLKIISHRGNVDGSNKNTENYPRQIVKVLNLGFFVEIDVWFLSKKYFLGHDEPNYEVSKDFLLNEHLWCHAKNKEAFEEMLDDNIHCFWHENDKYTLTSKGIPWCFPNNYHKNGITVLFGKDKIPPKNIGGICTDYPLYYSKLLNQLQS